MTDTLYCYPPNYTVLKNKADILDEAALDQFERNAVRVRLEQTLPTGDFDKTHLQAIHKHLFQDVYNGRVSFENSTFLKEAQASYP